MQTAHTKPAIAFGRRITHGLIAMTLSWASTGFASQAPSSTQSDVAILIQAGHGGMPEKVFAYHGEQTSLLETWDGADVRLWRRENTGQSWQLFRHWKNHQAAWAHSPDGQMSHLSSYVDGKFELFRADTYQLVYRVAANLKPNTIPDLHRIDVGDHDTHILELPELDPQGKPYVSLHISGADGKFTPWYPLGRQQTLRDFFQVSNTAFALRTLDGDWQLVRVNRERQAQAIQLPDMPAAFPRIRHLGKGIFAAGVYERTLRNSSSRDDGSVWRIYWDQPQGQIVQQTARHPGGIFQPGGIRSLSSMSGSNFIHLSRRLSGDDAGEEVNHYYRLDPKLGLTPLFEFAPQLPGRINRLQVMANGLALGIEELDDADDNGIPGEWYWSAQDANGGWHDFRQLLPGLARTDRIWRVREWMKGEGIGVQVVRHEANGSADYPWHWYLRDKASGQWLPAEKILPLTANLRVTDIRDRRDGLVDVITEPDVTQTPAVDSAVPYAVVNTHWMMRAEDGAWIDVRKMVGEHRPGLEKQIIAVNARTNGLMVDVRRSRDESPIRLLFYKNRDARWVMLDTALYALAESKVSDQRPFDHVEHAQVLADGKLVVLREKDDANGDGVAQDTQLLQSHAEGWRLLHIDNALGKGNVRLSFDRDRGLLVRDTDNDLGQPQFFRLDEDGNWQDVRNIVPGSPTIAQSAFVFAGGNGLAIQEAQDANGNGVFSEWFFYYKDQQGWRALTESLPNGFPALGTIINGGGRSAISVQEAGDANGNGYANEWRHFYRDGGQWKDLQEQMPDLPPSISEVRISKDGRLLSAVEDWDTNSNGVAFEKILAVWSDAEKRFVPLARQLGQAELPVVQAHTLWGGRGLAVQVAAQQSSAGVGMGGLTENESWQLYQLNQVGQWQRMSVGDDRLAELRGDRTGRLLAVRRQGDDHWELWLRQPQTGRIQRWGEYADIALHDVELDTLPDVFAVKVKDQWRNGTEEWALWRMGDDKHAFIGNSATASWFGQDNVGDGAGRVRFEGTAHYLDGRPVDNLPQPAIWFHNSQDMAGQDGAVYAPDLVDRALTAPGGQSAKVRIKAVGYGPSGTVILYQVGPRMLASAFTNGTTWVESRSLLGQTASENSKEVALLVNRLPDGSERLFRLDRPDHWIWSYRHDSGRIYYDDRGYFFNETDAVSEILSFRVDQQVHAFSQLGSYLFRPDLLEQRLGLPEHSLFELTQHDVERIELARRLAPEGVDIASLRPPHIEATAATQEVDEPFIELQLAAEGFGIDESSVSIRILGAGQARGTLPQATGDQRQQIRFTRRVSLVPGLNRLEVTIYDAKGLSHSQRLAVTYTPKVARKPTLYAAVIATADYKATNSLAGLPLTQNDAKTIYTALAEQNGKRFSKVELRTWCQNRSCQSAPTRQNLVSELPAFLAGAQNGDYILVYVSGHGLKIGSEYFMVPEDGDPNLPSTLVAWSQIQNWLRGSSLGKKMVLLDTCQSGAVYQRQRDQRRMVQQAAEQDGIYVLSAAAADASAYELSSIGNGVFTYVINEGLIGQADVGSDGSVSFEELSFHVARRVRELSSAQRVRMEPFVPIIDQQMDFTLASVNKQQQLFVRVSDISSFDSSALPGRSQWWQDKIHALDAGITLSNLPTGSFRLVVVEDQGKPLRSQLTGADGKVLGQWRFSDTAIDDMLQATKARLSEQQQLAAACATGRGLTLDAVCE